MATTTISKSFGSLTDPRIDRTKRHPLINLLTISICALSQVVMTTSLFLNMENINNHGLEDF
jgi:hypothetical protein